MADFEGASANLESMDKRGPTKFEKACAASLLEQIKERRTKGTDSVNSR